MRTPHTLANEMEGLGDAEAIDIWLNDQVGPAYDALKADPSRAVTADQIRARLAAEHAKAK